MTRQEPDVSVHVGKNGITESVVAELKDQVKKRGQVKVRMHRTAEEAQSRHESFARLAELAEVHLEKVVGYVAVYSRA